MSITHTVKTIEEHQKRIEIMKAYVVGERIEYRYKDRDWGSASTPVWDWETREYRVASKIPDSIDWSHVDPKYNAMARDKSERVYLFEDHPKKISQLLEH